MLPREWPLEGPGPVVCDKWLLPPGELHLNDWMVKRNHVVDGRLTYQYHKYEAAMKHCTNRSVAIDAGAHVGLFSYWMVRDFADVHAFEPVALHRECFIRNVPNVAGVDGAPQCQHWGTAHLHACALGEKDGMVSMITMPTSSGDTRVSGDGDIPMHPIDSFALADVGFIKIDAEGFELPILRGAAETIARCRPVILVEQKPGHAQRFGLGEKDAVPYLQSIGYTLRKEMSGDFIMTAT